MNRFCSNRCQQDWVWINETKPKIEAGLTSEHIWGSKMIRRYLTERDGYICAMVATEECGWNWEKFGDGVILDVDHIDGDRRNHLPVNLRFLCPNCHRRTPTWGHKARK